MELVGYTDTTVILYMAVILPMEAVDLGIDSCKPRKSLKLGGGGQKVLDCLFSRQSFLGRGSIQLPGTRCTTHEAPHIPSSPTKLCRLDPSTETTNRVQDQQFRLGKAGTAVTHRSVITLFEHTISKFMFEITSLPARPASPVCACIIKHQ